MEENNKEAKTVEQEVIAERLKEDVKPDATDDESGEGAEVKAEEDDYVDLTKEAVKEEKKFQEAVNTAEALDTPEKVKQAKEEIIDESDNLNKEPEFKSEEATETPSEKVPEIEPPKETTEEKPAEIPTETANVVKDENLIFLQYQCEDCEFKFWINNQEKALGDKVKCLNSCLRA